MPSPSRNPMPPAPCPMRVSRSRAVKNEFLRFWWRLMRKREARTTSATTAREEVTPAIMAVRRGFELVLVLEGDWEREVGRAEVT